MKEWFALCRPLADEPEGRERCRLCYRFRLQATFRQSQELGLDFIATTLSVSPHKPASAINQIGRSLAGSFFLERDFKKKDGFKRSVQLSRDWGIYRQNYCGCVYSRRVRAAGKGF